MRLKLLGPSALAALALLAGCGGGETQTPAVSTFTVTPAPTAAATAAPSAEVEPTVAPSAEAPSAAQPTAATESSAAPSPVSEVRIELQEITSELDRPVYVTNANDNSGRLFVVEKAGTIRIVRDGQVGREPFLDITDRVGSGSSEQGLLSVAFHPQFAENGRLFVNYTDRNGNTVISRFQASSDQADATSETVLLQIEQPYANHNGGLALFGPDGYLYIGMGDGGSGGDPQGNGQNPQALLGKMLRIDVDSAEPYAIPQDNPWADGSEGQPEIWATGLRNPWRFSFDRLNGDLYIADVGQNAFEEVSVMRAGSGGGANYGWNVTEGRNCFQGSCNPSDYVLPVAEYGHDVGCSVTGGYVYRGSSYSAIQGTYFFGDYCSGRIWALRETQPGTWEQAEVLQTNLQINSFGEDQDGELYVTSLGDNGLYRVVVP